MGEHDNGGGFREPPVPDDYVEEVKRLKAAPAHFRCLGMSFTGLLLLLFAIWLLTRLL